MYMGSTVIVGGGICIYVIICIGVVIVYSTPYHMVDASELIYGIYIGYFPHWCTLSNFGMWHFRGIFIAST